MNIFYDKNKEISRRVSNYLPTVKCNPFTDYEDTVIKIIEQIRNPLVLDIGGGKRCFLATRNISFEKKIISLDKRLQQLYANRDVDYLITADALNIPLLNDSVDVIISRSFMEHIPSVETFFQEATRILKKGGYFISIFPCKFAPFAIINQIISEYLSKKMLNHFVGETAEELGFTAYYNKCYFTGIRGLLKKYEFKIIDIKHYHFSSGYFGFFLPLFLLSCLYEIGTQPFKNLASYLLMVARKEV